MVKYLFFTHTKLYYTIFFNNVIFIFLVFYIILDKLARKKISERKSLILGFSFSRIEISCKKCARLNLFTLFLKLLAKQNIVLARYKKMSINNEKKKS